MENGHVGISRKILAWLVHGLTASGLVAGFFAILAVNEGNWRMVMFWLIIAFFIDGIDGTFARLVRIREALPKVDGKGIDTVVDFVNYAVVPAYFLYQAEAFSGSVRIVCVIIILLTSALYYGREGMILDDKYFVGFPVLWNILAFYIIFVLKASPELNALIILIFAILHFVPLKFPYPSRESKFQIPNLIFSSLIFLQMVYIVFIFPEYNRVISILSIICGLYFMGLAIYCTLKE